MLDRIFHFRRYHHGEGGMGVRNNGRGPGRYSSAPNCHKTDGAETTNCTAIRVGDNANVCR